MATLTACRSGHTPAVLMAIAAILGGSLLAACSLLSPPLAAWTDASGQPLPDESVYWNYGPDHCEWQSAAFLHVGWPLGSHWMSGPPHRTYARDPEGLFADEMFIGTLDLDAELPATAADTGFRSRGTELWLDPADDGVAYLRTGDIVERWPRFIEFFGCG
ncbi:MAG TPA: hypothetical protein VK845_15255 [Gemmatimonadales bacterium]|nr:hypothetical protein [Gemmatimonadales bacterium]